MFFRKKKAEIGPVPVDEIHSLTQMGLSDEEIVKKLRAQGYSYEAIQKGMFQAIRNEVGSGRPQQAVQQPQQPQQYAQHQEPISEASDEEFDFDEFEPELSAQPSAQANTDVEDLIDTMLQEKLGDSLETIKTLKQDYKNLETEIKKLRDEINSLPKQQNMPVEEIKKRMDELESRIGGLERAFKQLLPSLSRNLDSFSRMVSQMKQPQQPPQQYPQQPYPQQPQPQQDKKKKYDDISPSDFYGFK